MEQKPTVWQIGSKYGLITGLILTALSLILLITALTTNTWFSLLQFAVLIAGFVMAHKAFKNEGDGFMTYGEGLGIGTIVAGISGTIASIFSYIYMKFIDTNYMANIWDQQRIAMQEQGMDDEQIDQMMSMGQSFQSPELILLFGIISVIFFGFILALIVSAFTKNAHPEMEM